MKSLKISLMLFGIIILLALPMISAELDFDNIKYFDKEYGDYGKVIIKDWFGLLDLEELELKQNTFVCSSSCSAEIEIILYQDSALIDKVRFLTEIKDEWIQQQIRNYQFYIRIGEEEYDVDDYGKVCHGIGIFYINGTEKEQCSWNKIGSHKEKRFLWKEYVLGKEVEAGTYYVRLEGEKEPLRTVDWQITSQGKLIDEWTLWGASSELISYFPLNETSGKIGKDYVLNGDIDFTIRDVGNWREGIYQNGIYLNGSEYGKIENLDLNLTGTKEFSISLWFNSSEDKDGQILLCDYSLPEYAIFLELGMLSDTLYFLQNDMISNISVKADISGVTTFDTNTWYHVVVIMNYSGVWTWINGNFVSKLNSGENNLPYIQSDYNWTLGARDIGVFDMFFNGTIDEFYVYNRSLTETEISALYAGGSPLFPWAGITITLNSPDDDYISSTNSVTFNCSAEVFGGETVKNISLWTNMSGSWVLNETEDFTGIGGTKEISIFNKNIPDGSLDWTCRAFASETFSGWGINRTLTVDSFAPGVTITNPGDSVDYARVGTNLTLNWTVSGAPDTCWYFYDSRNITVNCLNLNATFTIDEDWNNITFYANDSANNINFTNQNWTYKVWENSEDYTNSTWETSSETFVMNISCNGSAIVTGNLIYNGTPYTGTKTGDNEEMTFARIITFPSGMAHKNFYWSITYGSDIINTTNHVLIIGRTILVSCNATHNVAYINFTFKNEANGSYITGDIDTSTWYYWLGEGTEYETLLHTNLSSARSYAFCFAPPDKTLHHNTILQYSKSGYPQRRWTYSTDLTNTTKNQILYLLGSADGIYSVYQVQTANGEAIQDVTVQVERKISGTWTMIEQGITDSAGAVTFWLNPDYDHRLIFTKTGYVLVQITLRPSSSTYTVTMGGVVGEGAYNETESLEGIKWTFSPPVGRLAKNTEYTFTFNVTASLSNLVACKMELINSTDNILNSATGCTSVGGNISVTQNTSCCNKIWGKYYVDVGAGYVVIDSDAYWITNITSYTPDRGTLWHFIYHMKDLKEFGGEEGRTEFSRVVLFFLFLTIVLAALCFSTGWDFASPGGILGLVCVVIWMASFAGFLDLSNITPWEFMDKYIVAFIVFLLTAGYFMNTIRRTTS